MLKKASLIAAVALLAACGQQEPAAESVAAAKPLESGIDTTGFDTTVRPQDDFNRYVNGSWEDRTEIPADKSNFGMFTVLADEAEVALREIIEGSAAADAPAGSEAQKVGDFYNSFMNETRVEERDLEPLRDTLAAIDALETHADVFRYMGEMQRYSVRVPIGFYVSQDAKAPTEYAVYLTQSGLGMPNRDYYIEEKFAETKGKYQQYVADMLAMAEFENPADAAAAVLALEDSIAAKHWSPVENRDRNKTYNKLSKEELAGMSATLDWPTYLDAAGIGSKVSHVIVRQPSYVEALEAIVTGTPVAVWKDYFRFHQLNGAAPYLSKRFVDRHFEFNGRTLGGTEEISPRWKRAVSLIDDSLGEAVGRIYVEQHFKPEAKERMKELVANLIDAFDQGIDGLEWMSAATKEQAHDKLNKFTPKIGYPDKWRDYSSMTITADDLFENIRQAEAFGYQRQVNKLGAPIDRTEWFMTPQTVNAYYSSTANEIVFPAAILQPPFFNLAADDAVNYGGIGAVIGHEISHGFDDQGRKSDGDGVLRDWWTEADAKAFEERAAKLGAQFDKYCPFEDACVNGKFTMGENIGDLSGLAIAYQAYRMSLNGEAAPVIDGMTGDQRFFMGWAQVWRRLHREENLRMRLAADPHSPAEYRINGIVRNLDAWYDAFDVKEGDALYLPPEERVKIW